MHLLFFVGYIIVNLIHIYFGLLCNKIVAPNGQNNLKSETKTFTVEYVHKVNVNIYVVTELKI